MVVLMRIQLVTKIDNKYPHFGDKCSQYDDSYHDDDLFY